MLNKKPTEVDALDMANLNEKGEPVEERLKDVKSALGIYATLRKGDEKSALNRARVDSMFDGVPPYNGDKLRANGQAHKTNLDFGEAQRALDISVSAYVDLYSSLEKLVEVKGTIGEGSQIQEMEAVVEEETTHLLRNLWPEFHSSYLRLCTTFIKHGVSVAYFDSPEDWRFRVGGFSDILIPRQTPASENCIDVAVGIRSYLVHELFHFIKNEKAATTVGWNVDEVKRVIKENVKTTGRGTTNSSSLFTDYEAIQAELKNNDLYTGLQNPTVSVLHFWVREMDGSVSHYIAAEDNPNDFLYKKISRFSSPEQAYIMFTYGVGTNGTFHSIRGLGQRIFSQIQTLNKLRCQMIDGAMLGSAVMIQPESQRALDELQFSYYGAYAILSPGVNIVEKAIPNIGNTVQPALTDLTNQLQQNTDTLSTYGPVQGSPYRNQMQVASDIDVSTRLSGASLNLFYASWNRLLREVVRRVATTKKNDPAIKEFYRRCEERGVPANFVKTLDLSKTKAVRSVGSGSKAGRMVSLREVQGMYGRLDEVGRRNLDRDIIATNIGYDQANRYIPPNPAPRTTVDDKIAYLENQQLSAGVPVPVLPTELHGSHLQAHVPALTQLIEALNTGQADPVQSINALQAFYQHISDTLAQVAEDPALEAQVGAANQILQYAEQAINNTMASIQSQQRKEAEAGAEAGAEGGQHQEGASPADLKMQQAQIQMDIARMKAEQEMDIKQRKFEQDQAIKDAEAAMKFRQDKF